VLCCRIPTFRRTTQPPSLGWTLQIVTTQKTSTWILKSCFVSKWRRIPPGTSWRHNVRLLAVGCIPSVSISVSLNA